MTTGEQLDNISTVSNTTALIHLMNPSGEGGTDRLIPYDEIVLDLQIPTMSIDLAASTMAIEIQRKEIDAEISGRYLSIDLQITNKEINNVCS